MEVEECGSICACLEYLACGRVGGSAEEGGEQGTYQLAFGVHMMKPPGGGGVACVFGAWGPCVARAAMSGRASTGDSRGAAWRSLLCEFACVSPDDAVVVPHRSSCVATQRFRLALPTPHVDRSDLLTHPLRLRRRSRHPHNV